MNRADQVTVRLNRMEWNINGYRMVKNGLDQNIIKTGTAWTDIDKMAQYHTQGSPGGATVLYNHMADSNGNICV